MKLTAPQKRLLSLIIENPMEAQAEIDTKLSTRNVMTNLIKLGAISGQGHTEEPKICMAGIWYRATDEGYDAAGIEKPSIDGTPAEGDIDDPIVDVEPTMLPTVADEIEAYQVELKEHPIGLDVTEQIREYAYAGSDDRRMFSQIEGAPEIKAERVEQAAFAPASRITITTGQLPMPEIDPVDEPIEFIPVQFVNSTVSPEEARNFAPSLSFSERAVKVGLPNKIKNLMIGTGEVGSATWKKNAHKATEDPRTGVIVCECSIKTKSRKLQSVLHKTTRIIPTVTEV